MRSRLVQFVTIVTCLALVTFVEAALNKGFLEFRTDVRLNDEGTMDPRLSSTPAFLLKVPSSPSVLRLTIECNARKEDLMVQKSPTDGRRGKSIVSMIQVVCRYG